MSRMLLEKKILQLMLSPDKKYYQFKKPFEEINLLFSKKIRILIETLNKEWSDIWIENDEDTIGEDTIYSYESRSTHGILFLHLWHKGIKSFREGIMKMSADNLYTVLNRIELK